MKAHIIENGKVTNTIEVNSLDFMSGLIDGSVGGIGWAWDGQTLSAPALPTKTRPDYIAEVKAKAKTVRDGGAIINGMEIATDAEARSLLTGAKVHPRATRKIVAKGGRTILTEAAYNAVVQGVADFLQAVFDKEYDLLELIDATADADLAALDLDSGWPV